MFQNLVKSIKGVLLTSFSPTSTAQEELYAVDFYPLSVFTHYTVFVNTYLDTVLKFWKDHLSIGQLLYLLHNMLIFNSNKRCSL